MRDCKVFNSWMNQRAKTYRSLVNAKSLRDIGPFIPGVRCWDSLVRTRDGHAIWAGGCEFYCEHKSRYFTVEIVA